MIINTRNDTRIILKRTRQIQTDFSGLREGHTFPPACLAIYVQALLQRSCTCVQSFYPPVLQFPAA